VNLRVAEIERAAGRHEAALSFALRQISLQSTRDPTAYRIAVASAIELDDLDTAKRVVNALNAAAPQARDWLIESARIIRHQDGPKAAVEHVLANLRDVSDPDNEVLLRGLVADLNKLGRAADGLAYVDAALARDPTRASLHELRARALLRLQRIEEATTANERALQLDGQLATALDFKAFLALERGDAKAALEALAAAAAAAPRQAEYSYAAAAIARGLGDDELAMTRLEDALVREPGFASAASDLAWLLAEDRRDLERALGLARLAADRETSAESLDTLGWVRHQRGEYAQAVASFRSALDLDPNRTAAQMRLGMSLVALGETDEARSVFERILEGPPSPEIDLAREELARLGDS
jgi:tetratricopeptide (TPR) repeat protein